MRLPAETIGWGQAGSGRMASTWNQNRAMNWLGARGRGRLGRNSLSEEERGARAPREQRPTGNEPGWGSQPQWGPPAWQQGQQPWAAPQGPPPHGQQPWPAPQGNQPWPAPQGQQPWQQGPQPGQQLPGQPWPSEQGQHSWQGQPGPYGSPAGSYVRPAYIAPPKPGVAPLRPLMFGEILDGSFQTVRRNPQAMFGAALLGQSLSIIAVAFVGFFGVASLGEQSMPAWMSGRNQTEIVSILIGVIAGGLLLLLLSVLLSAVLQGVMVVPVARALLNRRTTFRQMWKLAKGRIGALIGLAALLLVGYLGAIALLVILAVVLAETMGGVSALISIPLFIGLIIAMVWVYIRFMVAPAAIVIEELGVLGGLGRSWALTRNNWWRILGISLVISILIGIIGQIVTMPLGLISGGTSFLTPHSGAEEAAAAGVGLLVASTIVSALVGAVGYAFQTSVMALLYLDLRMRKDGLDLVLIRSLESGEDPDGVPGRGATVYSAGRPGYPGGQQSPGGAPPMYG